MCQFLSLRDLHLHQALLNLDLLAFAVQFHPRSFELAQLDHPGQVSLQQALPLALKS
ncbi:hypothetical protein [Deinococcus peraridilitoris]|uniref:hypothetical protein n=1 Tax=Deinococcus peraridilitoris TaxID=432329 RepID=UPI001FDFFC44|nr:hypothetical protein [Deinococcus peraridilitoris]